MKERRRTTAAAGVATPKTCHRQYEKSMTIQGATNVPEMASSPPTYPLAAFPPPPRSYPWAEEGRCSGQRTSYGGTSTK